ncbi:carboxypeptidase-like regulatory domain-containing protein [Skermanella stibiiresistens]
MLHQGQVLRDDGAPVPGALVAVVSGTAPTPEVGIRCDSEGRFRIALPPGRFRLTAHAPDGALGSTEIEAVGATAAAPVEIRIVLERSP